MLALLATTPTYTLSGSVLPHTTSRSVSQPIMFSFADAFEDMDVSRTLLCDDLRFTRALRDSSGGPSERSAAGMQHLHGSMALAAMEALPPTDALDLDIPDDSAPIAIANGVDPSFSIEESETDYKFTVNVPGIDAEDVRVSIDGRILHIEADNTRTEGLSTIQVSVRRVVALPSDADGEVFEQRFEDGKATVVLPKASAVAGEAEDLAATSPRFARWARANGYLRKERKMLDGSGPISDDDGRDKLALEFGI